MNQSASKPAEFIQPPSLRAKVGGRLSGVDADAVARAEAALAGLSNQFEGWLRDEAKKLEEAHAAVKAEGPTVRNMGVLYTRAHDLKGLGATYGFPLISRIAGALCRLMDGVQGRLEAPLFLVDAHVDAINAVIRDDIRDPDHPVGRALADALEARAKAFAPTDEKGRPIPR